MENSETEITTFYLKFPFRQGKLWARSEACNPEVLGFRVPSPHPPDQALRLNLLRVTKATSSGKEKTLDHGDLSGSNTGQLVLVE